MQLINLLYAYDNTYKLTFLSLTKITVGITIPNLLTCYCRIGVKRDQCGSIIYNNYYIFQVLKKILMTLTKRKQLSDQEKLIENGDPTELSRSNIKGDELNIATLLFLYTLQGIPLGLAGAIPMLLQNRGITYTQQVSFIL